MDRIILTSDGKLIKETVTEVELAATAGILQDHLFRNAGALAYPLPNNSLALFFADKVFGYARIYDVSNPLPMTGLALVRTEANQLCLRPFFGSSNGTQEDQGAAITMDLMFTPPADCKIVFIQSHALAEGALTPPFVYSVDVETGELYFAGLPNTRADGGICLGSGLTEWWNSQRPLGNIPSLIESMDRAVLEWQKATFNGDLTGAMPKAAWDEWMCFNAKTKKSIPCPTWRTHLPKVLIPPDSVNGRAVRAICNYFKK
jgi:hypothetical protein